MEEMGEKANLQKGNIFVVGCSTSEVIGAKIGTNSSPEVAQVLFNALYDYANEKADLSAVSAFYDEKGKLKIWTDSEKARVEHGAYGNYSGTMVGVGSFERPLRVSQYVIDAIASVDLATSGYKTKLANVDAYDDLQKDIAALNNKIDAVSAKVDNNTMLIEWILNHMNNVPDNIWENLRS